VILSGLRRLYHWVLGWANRPAALWALFCISFAESSFFPIPPDVLLIPLCLGKPKLGFRFAAVCTAASVLGGMAGYGIGYLSTDLAHRMLHWFASDSVIETVRRQFDENTFLYVAIAGFTPVPYKVFTIAAGIFHVNFPLFVAASVCSRGARFFLEAIFIRLWGERAKAFLEKRFELATILFALALLGGFLAVKYLF
jgi:membrane protein YqaA with SNARE-associated domain